MPKLLNRPKVRQHLEKFDLRSLFIEELGWDYGGKNLEIFVRQNIFYLEAVAHKRGMVLYQHIAKSGGGIPDRNTRRKIEKQLAKNVHEHIIVFAANNRKTHFWQWVKRERGQPERTREHIFNEGQTGEALDSEVGKNFFHARRGN